MKFTFNKFHICLSFIQSFMLITIGIDSYISKVEIENTVKVQTKPLIDNGCSKPTDIRVIPKVYNKFPNHPES